ncbi:nicotinamide N-methyltransferase-like [Pelodytes ibericus]
MSSFLHEGLDSPKSTMKFYLQAKVDPIQKWEEPDELELQANGLHRKLQTSKMGMFFAALSELTFHHGRFSAASSSWHPDLTFRIRDNKCSGRDLLVKLFSPDADDALEDDSLYFTVKKLNEYVVSGSINGEILTDCSFAPIIHQILPIYNIFQHITVLELDANCFTELQKWYSADKDAFDWSYMIRYIADLQGTSDQWQQKEGQLRSTVKCILKCDPLKESFADPGTVQKADCLISMWMLELLSKDKDEYRRNLKKLSALIRLGGKLILISSINGTYLRVGEQSFSMLSVNEPSLRKMLASQGFSVETFQYSNSQAPREIHDASGFAFIIAIKVRIP